MLFVETPGPLSVAFERQLAASFHVDFACFLHSNASYIQSPSNLPISLAHGINTTEVSKSTQDNLPFLAPRKLMSLVAPLFLKFEGQPEANVLVDGGTVVSPNA